MSPPSLRYVASFAPKYTDEQREAIDRLIAQEGLTAAQAVRKAAEGVYGLEPFEMPRSTAAVISKRLKRSRERKALAHGDVNVAMETLARRSVELTVRELRRLEKRIEAGEVRPNEMRAWLRCQRELYGVVNLIQKAPPRASTESEDEEADFLDQLRRKLDEATA